MIRILITEDSATVALILKTIFNEEPDMEVVGIAQNGQEAVEMTHELKPDLITMDIRMPVLDGFGATRMIMSTTPTPIVIISSSVEDEELQITFRAIEEGALAVIEKPRGFANLDSQAQRRELVDTVRAMAEVPVVKRRNNGIKMPVRDIYNNAMAQKTKKYNILGIVTSTGGPRTLQNIMASLPQGFPIPIVIVQHISKGFISGLVTWLQGNTLLNVKLVEHAEPLLPGTVYFAPDDNHILVERNSNGICANLESSDARNGFRPSGDVLFESLAENFPQEAIGLLLSGMGQDGSKGLLKMRQEKCHTLIQDEKSAVVFGMPGSALALDAVDQIVKLESIPSYLVNVLSQ